MLELVLALSPARAVPLQKITDSPIGTWLTAKGNAVVQISPCGKALCGEIAGIARAPNEPVPTDFAGRSQCGLVILNVTRSQGGAAWHGTVTDPRNGSRYGARLHLDTDGNLRLRGYLAIPLLGETQTWHRFAGRLGNACSMS